MVSSYRNVLVLTISFLIAVTVQSATIHVPADQPTIQAGIDAASNGDTVLVAPGEYLEVLVVTNRSLVIRSQGEPVQTTIGYADTGYVRPFTISGYSIVKLDGFKFRGFTEWSPIGWGALYAESSSVNITNCVFDAKSRHGDGAVSSLNSILTVQGSKFENCVSGLQTLYSYGGAISGSGNLFIDDCQFIDNSAAGYLPWSGGGTSAYGGAVFFTGDTVSILNCLFRGNSCPTDGNLSTVPRSSETLHPHVTQASGGAGIISANYILIENCEVSDNLIVSNNPGDIPSAAYGSGGFTLSAPAGVVQNCVFQGNSATVLQGSPSGWFPRVNALAGALKVSGGISVVNNVFKQNSCQAYSSSYSAFPNGSSAKGGALAFSGTGLFESNSFLYNKCLVSVAGTDIDTSYSFIAEASGGGSYGSIGTRNLFAFNSIEAKCGLNLSSYCRPQVNPEWELSAFDTTNCCLFFANVSILGQDTISGSLAVNPFFCSTPNGIFTVKSSSPALPQNNSCGVLIGAFGEGCPNLAPGVTSPLVDTATEDLLYVYHAVASDTDGPSLNYSFANYATWLTADADSLYGTPTFGRTDTSFIVIVSDGFLADTAVVTLKVQQLTPEIDTFLTDNLAGNGHVLDHTPTFAWDYYDPTGSSPQTQVELAVGTDNNWQFAEKWNPAPFAMSETTLVYDGAALVDGQTYFTRLRAYNGSLWSPWRESSFRMNSVPSVPSQLYPLESGQVGLNPALAVTNSSDAENDALEYDFEVYSDSMLSALVVAGEDISSGTSQTVWTVPSGLSENARFWWRVLASDGYESSAWSTARSFVVNANSEPPAAFTLLTPNNFGLPTFDLLPTLDWTSAVDPDPGDIVRYTMELAIDPNFNFDLDVDSIPSDSFAVVDSLLFGQHYWWRVTATDGAGHNTLSSQTLDFWTWELGDVDHSHGTDISDLTVMIDHLFINNEPIVPEFVGDLDEDCVVDISDLTLLIDHLFISFVPLGVDCE